MESLWYKKMRQKVTKGEGVELLKGRRRERPKEEGRVMKSLRTLARQEPRKLGNFLIIACMVFSLGLLSIIKTRYCPAPYGNSELPLKASMNMVADETVQAAQKNETSTESPIEEDEDDNENNRVELAKQKLVCYETSVRSDTCEAEGDIRVQPSSYTVYMNPSPSEQEWKMKPYARKNDIASLLDVKEWTLKPSAYSNQIPQCTINHRVPAMIFSVGGFSGNVFHDFTDLLIPLFISSYQFHGEVQFLVADTKTWWIGKFNSILKKLSNYEIIDLGSDGEAVRCFPKAVIGPSFHKELGVNTSETPGGYSILDFKELLRKSFGLERHNAITIGAQVEESKKPRLLILSRQSSRRFVNEGGMEMMALSLGFDVKFVKADIIADIAEFARLVNSADVLLGVHGSGLTNMLFLPEGAVVIQIIPLGNLEWIARGKFKDPTMDMKLNYLDYVIEENESSLIEHYPKDDPVLKDPLSVHQQGWGAIKAVYLDKQNVRPHLGKLRNILLEALKLLSHNTSSAL